MPEAKILKRRAEQLWETVQSDLPRTDPALTVVRLAELRHIADSMRGSDKRAWLARIASVALDDTRLEAARTASDELIERLNSVCGGGNLIGEEVVLVYTLYQKLTWLKVLLEDRGRGDPVRLDRLEPDALVWVGRRRSAAF
jgi:hypothetical protein